MVNFALGFKALISTSFPFILMTEASPMATPDSKGGRAIQFYHAPSDRMGVFINRPIPGHPVDGETQV